MKLLRYGNDGMEKPAVLDAQGNLRDLSGFITDLNASTLGQLDWFERLNDKNVQNLPLVDKGVRIGACVGMPGKIVCVGYNSKLHAQEMGVTPMVGSDMLVFLKPSCAACGPFDPILYTRHTKKLDWEAELAIVIGKKGKYISQETAKDYIFGYTCMNDLSERYLQMETQDTQYTKGKGFDNAAPLGPYLVTKDEIPNSSQLQVKLWVNGQLRQDFNTGDYIHNDSIIVSYLSQYFTLYPGDVISMGSAPGSAKSWGKDAFLKPDDTVVMEINGLGQQEQRVVVE